MRALSPYAGYGIQLIEADERVVVDPTGKAREHVISKPVIAQFEKMGLLDYEIEAALEAFNFSGIPDGVNPLTRVACFDSETYVMRYRDETERAAMLEKIDNALVELQRQFPNEYIIVEKPASEKPWGKYDEHDLETILQLQEQTGISPEAIRLYELENQNRSEIVDAMKKLEDPEGFETEDDERVIVSA